jgi:uncharacterized protein (DUF1015 family)
MTGAAEDAETNGGAVPEIQPFAGIRYRVPDADLQKVLAPPYDVIPPSYQDELYARDPRNIVRVVLNREAGDAAYLEAGRAYRSWLDEGVLAADDAPGLYVLEQAFTAEGRPHTRLGLLARFRATDKSAGEVLPHEHTRAAAKEDRYRVLRETRANFSPIFLMSEDADGSFAGGLESARQVAPTASYTDDGGVAQRLWRVTDPAAVGAFQRSLARSKAYIADGHHRYATALRYRDEVGPEGAWTFGYFTPLDSPGLLVLPYHRLLASGPTLAEARAKLQGMFLLNDAPDAAAAARAAAQSTMPYAFALAEPGGGALVAEALPEAEDLLAPDAPPSLRALDTYFLHQAVLPRLLGLDDSAVRYVHSQAEAEHALAGGHCRLALLLRATPVRQIVDVAEAGESMPAKSTFFHPKLASALVIHPLVV